MIGVQIFLLTTLITIVGVKIVLVLEKILEELKK